VMVRINIRLDGEEDDDSLDIDDEPFDRRF
jgi:hypothetical protein